MKFIKDKVTKTSNKLYEKVPKKYFDGLRISEYGTKYAPTDVLKTIDSFEELKK